MKYSTIILAFVAAVAAQSVTELVDAIPACAKPALDDSAKEVGCGATDYGCQCGPKKQELVVLASPKVVEACGTEAAAVLEATNALCEFVDANPDSAGGESSSAAAETTSAPSESSAAPSTTDSASGPGASISSAAESISSDASSKIDDLMSKTSSAVAAATSTTPNAAGMNAVNMGAMLGAAGVVAAMI